MNQKEVKQEAVEQEPVRSITPPLDDVHPIGVESCEIWDWGYQKS